MIKYNLKCFTISLFHCDSQSQTDILTPKHSLLVP